MTNSNDWCLNVVSGGVPVNFPTPFSSSAIFSQDGRYAIVILYHQIRIYFISTRQCIRTIDFDCSEVITAHIDPSNPNHVLLFSKTAKIVAVNWKEKMDHPIISSTKVPKFTSNVLSVPHITANSYYFICGKSKSYSSRSVLKINRSSKEFAVLLEVDQITHFTISHDLHTLLFITSSHQALLYNLSVCYSNDEESNPTPIKNQIESTKEIIPFTPKAMITSVAVSNDSVIAVGCHLGSIQILYGGLASSKPQRLFKWHIDQVKSLHFSPDNTYLLSGGQEKVLVFWHVESDKTQFLPRLNGVIDKINIDRNKPDYYSLLLASSETDHELLIISAVDLVSRLAVNSIKPDFANALLPTLAKTKKRYVRDRQAFDTSKLKYNYSCHFEVHPTTKHLYFPRGSSIQAYDRVKNEQVFVQDIAPTLTTGKVRSENKLTEPIVSLLSFTHNGEWMCTFDSMATSEVDNLLSKDDTQYALKFWKYIKNDDNGHWELTTKIVDPHGSSIPVLSIIAAPSSYHQGLAFATADNKGGLRIWRPRIPKEIYQKQVAATPNRRLQQTAWTLRKSKPSGALASDSVDVCWSDDGSIIFMGHETSISTISTNTFEPVPYDFFQIPSLSGSKIRSLSLVDDNLIVLSKTRISSFNLLNGELNSLVAQVNSTNGGKNLIAVDQVNKLVCLAVNYYQVDKKDNISIKSKVLIFKPDQLSPVAVLNHDQGISSIRYFSSSFIFVDLESRVGYISSQRISTSIEDDLTNDMNNMLLKAQATADVINNTAPKPVKIATGGATGSATSKADESLQVVKAIDVNTFQPVFDNIEGIPLDTLFDRIMNIVK